MLHKFTVNGMEREDSNPRNGFPFTRFPSVRLQPLGHSPLKIVILFIQKCSIRIYNSIKENNAAFTRV